MVSDRFNPGEQHLYRLEYFVSTDDNGSRENSLDSSH